jgi:hypothetical protein
VEPGGRIDGPASSVIASMVAPTGAKSITGAIMWWRQRGENCFHVLRSFSTLELRVGIDAQGFTLFCTFLEITAHY